MREADGYARVSTREQNEQRQAEGIAVARAQGVRFGRPPLEQPEDFPAVQTAWREKRELRAAGSEKAERHPQNISQMGAGIVKNGKESTGFAHLAIALNLMI